MATKEHFDFRRYLNERGINDESIEGYGLTWDEVRQRIRIPLKDGPARLYDPFFAEKRAKWEAAGQMGTPPAKMTWERGLRDDETAPPYPSYSALEECEVICESEFDAILLNQAGILAATGTCGAGTFKPEWAQVCGKNVKVLAFDNDPAGYYGMVGGTETYVDSKGRTQTREHYGAARRIVEAGGFRPRIVRWPPGKPDGYDVGDFFKEGGTAERFGREILDTAEEWTPTSKQPRTVETSSSQQGSEGWDEKLAGLFATPRSLAAQGMATVPWIVEGLLAKGAITELDGKVKVSGKTTLALGLTRCITTGRPFARMRTERVRVVYLTEQGQPSFQAALGRAGLADSDEVAVLHWHRAAGAPFEAVVRAAVAKAKEIGAEVLVVDTIGQWAGLKGDDENKAGPARDAVQPLQMAAAEGLAVLVLRHARKAGGDLGDEGRGSSAFSGAVDIILSLKRAEGNRPRVRVLHAVSRFTETPESLAIELSADGLTYIALGNEGTLDIARVIDKIITVGPRTEAEAISSKKLATRVEARRDTVDDAVEEMVRTGWMNRKGSGKKGSPYLVWLTSKASGKESDDEMLVPTPSPIGDEKPNGHLGPDAADPMVQAALDMFYEGIEMEPVA